MKFNLDLAAAELAPWGPRCQYASSTALDLDRVEAFTGLSVPRAGTLYLIEPDDYRSLPDAWERAGCAFATLGQLEDARQGMPAIALEAPYTVQEAMSALLDMRSRLDAWSDGMLRAIAKGAPLQEVFDVVARAFANPILLSDSALLFVLVAGTLPEGFQDRFWTPALETGLCPVERYSETWRRVTADDRLRRHACLVEDRKTGRHYLYCNLVSKDGMHGMIDLVDVNAPFTPADIALVEYATDLLTLAIQRSTYRELSPLANDPLFSLLEGRPVDERALRTGLEKRGWSAEDAYCVCFAVNTVDSSALDLAAAARLDQTADMALLYPAPPRLENGAGTSARHYEMGRHVQQQLERDFPSSCVFSTDEGCVMVMSERDRSFATMRDRFERKPLDASDAVELLVGVSSVHTDFRNLAAARSQAQRAVKWAETAHGGMVGLSRACFYDDVFCLDLGDRLEIGEGDGWLVPESVARLARNDAAEGTEYVATLRAYLGHGCNVNRTAEALFVHRNTLAYRIKRIREISGMDLERFEGPGDELLRAWLACRLMKDPSQ